MIKSAVTISLVKEAEGGPFVFWHDLAAGCAKAAELGYDAVEVFAPNADAIPVDELKALTAEHNLKVPPWAPAVGGLSTNGISASRTPLRARMRRISSAPSLMPGTTGRARDHRLHAGAI